MAIAARRHPADHLAVMPDRLVADRVGVERIDDETLQAQLAAAFLLANRRVAADEIVLLEIDEAAKPRLKRRVDRPIFAEPGAEALLQAHAEQRAHAKLRKPEGRAFA